MIDHEALAMPTGRGQLGRAFGTLATDGIRDLQADMTAAVSSHRVDDVVDVRVPADDRFGRRAGLSILDGRAVPEQSPFEPLVLHFEDTLQGFIYTSDRPGSQSIRLGLFDSVFDLELLDAKVQVSDPRAYHGRINATITGGVSVDDVHGKLMPAFYALVTSAIERDCAAPQSPPDCGCVASPTRFQGGKYFIRYFDTEPYDCVVTFDELESNVWIYNYLYPDLDIDGTLALSLGVWFSAVEVP